MPVQTRIQIRRGTSALWTASTDPLSNGEFGYDTTLKKFKIGDGTTLFDSLPWATILSSELDELIDDRVNNLFIAGSGISLNYNDSSNSFTISSPITAGSGIYIDHTSGNYSIRLNDPVVNAGDVIGLNTAIDNELIVLGLSNISGVVRVYDSGTTNGQSYINLGNSGILSLNAGLGGALTLSDNFSLGGVSSVGIDLDGGSLTVRAGDNTTRLLVVDNGENYGSALTLNDGFDLSDTSSYITSDFINNTLSLGNSYSSGLIDISGGINLKGTGVYIFTPVSSTTPMLSVTQGGVNVGALNINGTGLSTFITNKKLSDFAAPSTSVNFNNQKITNLGTPTSDSDAANKGYVDAVKQGLDVKDSVVVATTGNNLALSGLISLDGVSLSSGNRVLVKDQGTSIYNGIYNASPGVWSRSSDANSSDKVTAGLFTFVTNGDTYGDTGWVLSTNDTINLGSTNLVFTQFSAAGQVSAGSGLVKNGNTIDAGGTLNRILVNSDSIDISPNYIGQNTIAVLGTVATGVWQGTSISDTYLSTISTSGKVSNSATTATSANTNNAIVARNSSGNFSANNITASLSGTATNADRLDINAASDTELSYYLIFSDQTNSYGSGFIDTNLNYDYSDGSLRAPYFIGNGAGITSLNASNINSGTLGVGNGGTGQSSYSNGQLLIGSGTSLVKNTITAGTGIIITNGSGTITVSTDSTVIRTSGNQSIDNNMTFNRVIISPTGARAGLVPALQMTNNGDTLFDYYMGSGVLSASGYLLAGIHTDTTSAPFRIVINNAGNDASITHGKWNASTIATNKGGTGLTSYSTGDLIYASGSNILATKSIGSTGHILQVINGLPSWNGIDGGSP
jgi:hypothetical protein